MSKEVVGGGSDERRRTLDVKLGNYSFSNIWSLVSRTEERRNEDGRGVESE